MSIWLSLLSNSTWFFSLDHVKWSLSMEFRNSTGIHVRAVSFLPEQFCLPFSLYFQLKDLNLSLSQGNVIYFVFITISSIDLFSLSRTSMTRISDPLGILYTSFFSHFYFSVFFPCLLKPLYFNHWFIFHHQNVHLLSLNYLFL